MGPDQHIQFHVEIYGRDQDTAEPTSLLLLDQGCSFCTPQGHVQPLLMPPLYGVSEGLHLTHLESQEVSESVVNKLEWQHIREERQIVVT